MIPKIVPKLPSKAAHHAARCCPTHPGRLNHLWVLIGSILLLGARYSLDQFPEFHKGLPSLLMTGKLLGLVLLTWALVRRVKEKEAPAP